MIFVGRAAESCLGPSEKKYSVPFIEGGPAENLYTKSERLTVSCRVSWVWAEGITVYSLQQMLLPTEINHMQYSRLRKPLAPPGSDNCPGFFPTRSELVL